jgi:hypothetical protein
VDKPEPRLTVPLTRIQVSAPTFSGVGAMPIDPSLEQGAFGPEVTTAMGEAFEAACKELCAVGQLQMVRKLVAQRIIAAVRKGELDPVRLRAAALNGLPLARMSPAA